MSCVLQIRCGSDAYVVFGQPHVSLLRSRGLYIPRFSKASLGLARNDLDEGVHKEG